jgi:hypothetical protein
MKHNGASKTLILLIDGVYPISDLIHSKLLWRPLLSPGAAHDHRSATERSPESADEIGFAAHCGGRSGWRLSMMNEVADFCHRCLVFRLCLCAPKIWRVPEPVHSLLLPFFHIAERVHPQLESHQQQ